MVKRENAVMNGFTVKRLYYGEHKDWILKKHYAKRICSVSYAFGLIKDLKIIGVCTFGFPPNYNYNDGKCLFHNIKMKTLELNRLVINNSNQKNLLSYFLSSCLKLLPSPLALVSYADPNVNHTGYIYQATNWFYTGTSTAKKRYHFEDGSSFDIRRGIDNKGKIISTEDLLPTHRYLYFIGNKKQKREMINDLKMKVYTYPKGQNQKYKTTDLDMNYNQTLFEMVKL